TFIEYRLCLFHNSNCRDGFWFSFGKLFLVAIKDTAQDQARKDQGLRTMHTRNVHDTEFTARKRVDEHVHELAAFIMKRAYNSGHVTTCCQRFNLLLIRFQAEYLPYFVEGSLVAILLDQIYQFLPTSLIQSFEFANVLL